MHWISCVLLGLGYAGCLAAGVRIGRRKGRVVTVAAASTLAVILVRVVFRYFPAVEFTIFGAGAYADFRPWWGHVFAFLILGIGVCQMKAAWRRMVVEVFAGVLFVLTAHRLYSDARFDPAVLSGRPGPSHVCMQTSTYSCGAAAACTMLAELGVDSTESEMAALCKTSPVWGTDEFNVARGLGRKVRGSGRNVRIVEADWEDLKSLDRTALATMKLNLVVDHWVVVLHADESGVLVGDSIEGKVTLSKREFLARWRGVLVRVDGP